MGKEDSRKARESVRQIRLIQSVAQRPSKRKGKSQNCNKINQYSETGRDLKRKTWKRVAVMVLCVIDPLGRALNSCTGPTKRKGFTPTPTGYSVLEYN